MLWISWLVVGLYDVRFVTDSIFGTLFLHPNEYTVYSVVS